MKNKLVERIKFGLKVSEKISPKLSGKLSTEIFTRPQRIGRPDWEAELLKTADQVEVRAGVKIWRWGKAPYVILAHGWNGRGGQLGKFVKPLLESGKGVVLFDAPAHGESAGTRINLREYAEKLIALTNDYESVDAVIAHSFGGAATVYALHMGLPVERVILIASPANIEGIFQRFSKRLELGEATQKEFRAELAKQSHTEAQGGILHLANWVKLLPTRALIVHDPADPDVPYEDSLELQYYWPRAELLSVEKVGHRKILKSEEVINESVQFLKRENIYE